MVRCPGRVTIAKKATDFAGGPTYHMQGGQSSAHPNFSADTTNKRVTAACVAASTRTACQFLGDALRARGQLARPANSPEALPFVARTIADPNRKLGRKLGESMQRVPHVT